MTGPRSRKLVLSAILGSLAVVPSPVRAQTSDATALARQLFDQGRASLQARDYPEACEKFEASQRLDPGGGTLLNLALCYELSGRTATAWVTFLEALHRAQRDGRADRESFATEHIRALEPRVSRLRVVVPEAARVVGLEIRRNGAALLEGAWGEALPVDPGVQVIEASAPGKRDFRGTIRVEGDGVERTLPLPVLADWRPETASQPKLSPEPEAATPGSVQRVSGIVVAGVGATALGFGSWLGLRAIARQQRADERCPSPDHCQPSGIEASRDAALDARASTLLFVVGGTALAIGGYVFLSAPRKARMTLAPIFGPKLAGAVFVKDF